MGNKIGLNMVGKSMLRWGGEGGRELPFDAVTVTEGTNAGVMWRKNPVPRAWHKRMERGVTAPIICKREWDSNRSAIRILEWIKKERCRVAQECGDLIIWKLWIAFRFLKIWQLA